MLLPVEIEHPYERTPYATHGLIWTCVVVFVLQVALPTGALSSLVLKPKDFAPHQLVTSAFLHVGVLHLVFNMLFLWVYGRYVEDRLGPARFLAVYLACSAAGDLLYLALGEVRPTVGASGAIAGLMGLVLVAAPWVEVRTHFVFYVKVSEPIHFAAFWLIAPWLLVQLLTVRYGAVLGVAVAAHVGGFALGAGLGALFRSERLKGTPWYVDPAPPGGGIAARRRLRRARAGPAAPPPPAPPTRPRGAPRERPPAEVRLVALDPKGSRVAVAKLLMIHAGLEPEEAMRLLEGVAAGRGVSVAFPNRAAADVFVEKARALGADARQGSAEPVA